VVKEDNLPTQFLELITHELETNFVEDDAHLTDLTIFLVDLANLRLRLSAAVPFIQVTQEDINRLGPGRVVETVRQELYVRQERPGSALILVDGAADFLRFFGHDPYWAVILDRERMTDLLNHPNPKRAFLETLREQIPLRFLSPYEPDQPVEGSQFHGRKSEINLVLTHPDRSFVIEGGRRIGKTSLMWETRRQMQKQLSREQLPRLVSYDFWNNTDVELFVADVMRHFGETPRPARGTLVDYFPHFIKLMKKRCGGRIVFFLDEVDDLIEQERRRGYPLLGLLRRMVTERSCRCLIAGFRLLTEERHRADTPLTFCQRLPLSNLPKDQARAMLVEPMQNMGVDLQKPVFPEILRDSGGHPQLLQLYGQSLINLLDEEETRTVTSRHVSLVKKTGVVYDRLVETLVDNTSDLELALVCSLANEDEFDMLDVNKQLETHGIHRSTKELFHIVRALEGIGVIRRSGQKAEAYQFAIPLQPALASRRQTIVKMVWQKAERAERRTS
jgi:hypothetical protein